MALDIQEAFNYWALVTHAWSGSLTASRKTAARALFESESKSAWRFSFVFVNQSSNDWTFASAEHGEKQTNGAALWVPRFECMLLPIKF